MPAPRSDTNPRPKARHLRPWLLAGTSGLVIVVVGAGVLYNLRGAIGARLAVDYLARRGVPAEIVIDRIDLGGFVGHGRLGPAADPDLTVDRIEAEFEPIPVLRSGLAAPRLRSLRLIHPRLKASFDGKQLGFGTLQPLVDDAMKGPAAAGPALSVQIQGGELRLASFAGPVLLTGDAAIDQGRLVRASAHLAPTVLTLRPGLILGLRSADARLTSREDRLFADVDAALTQLDGPVSTGPAHLTATASLPYGAPGLARLDGAVAGDVHLTADRASAGTVGARGLDVSGRIGGTAHGPVQALILDLTSQLDLAADRLDAAGTSARRVRIAGSASHLHWATGALSATRADLKATADAAATLSKPAASLALSDVKAHFGPRGWGGGAGLVLDAAAASGVQSTPAGRFRLAGLAMKGRGRADLDSAAPPVMTLDGSLSIDRGGVDAASAARIGDGLAAVADPKRVEAALRAFSLSAPAWRLASMDGAIQVRLVQPLRLTAADSAAVVAARTGDAALTLAASGVAAGAFTLAVSGPGLPGLDLAVSRYRLAGGTGEASLRLAARFDRPLLHQAVLDGAGVASFAPSAVRFSPAAGCLDGRLARLGDDTPALAEKLTALLCVDGAAPFASIGPDGWRLQARLEKAAANLPIAQATVDGGEARLTLVQHHGAASGRLELTALRALDVAPDKRFNPMRLAGALDLAAGQWRGPIQVSDAAKGRALAVVTVRQLASGPTGEAEIAADHLDFAAKTLQPVELSPLAALVNQVDARTRFAGHIAWSDGKVTSGGRFTTDNASFNSPLGKVTGAHADVTFDSLLPPTAAPGQVFTAENVAWIAPLTQVGARFALTPTATELAEAHATLAHGVASISDLTVPFAPDRTLKGTLVLKQLDLGELVSGSSLADSVSITAKIDGSVPFSLGPAGVTLADGLVASIGPGRLSIKRQALTGAVATGGAAGAQPNAVQDFAYQALENLAFDSLEARVASRPQGRLGAIFHIKGRNDPPRATETRIGLFDLLSGHAFDKPIDLPKGTPVDLTLDTSLNFDELLKAYSQIGKGSGPFQP